jgi:hypothetical protein
MNINILSGSNAPESTKVLMGFYNNENMFIDATTLTGANLTKYNKFVTLVASGIVGKVDGTPFSLECNHVSPNEISEEETILEFSLLSAKNKKIITDFELLLK